MAAKARRGKRSAGPSGRPAASPVQRSPAATTGGTASPPGRIAIAAAAILVVVVAVLGVELVFFGLDQLNARSTATPAAASAAPASFAGQATAQATHSDIGVVVQGQGGTWVNVTPDELAQMLEHKDFTFLNVKTPYIGEIDGTDLYIPYTDLVARQSELPADKGAKIVVYCRTGTTSAIAAQTLLDLGYTNVWNLDGGMVAWQASGRQLVNKNR